MDYLIEQIRDQVIDCINDDLRKDFNSQETKELIEELVRAYNEYIIDINEYEHPILSFDKKEDVIRCIQNGVSMDELMDGYNCSKECGVPYFQYNDNKIGYFSEQSIVNYVANYSLHFVPFVLESPFNENYRPIYERYISKRFK